MSLTADQVELLHHKAHGWLGAWFVTHFDAARKHAVASMAGGTYWINGQSRGWYDTTAKGWVVSERLGKERQPVTVLTWAEVRAWSESVDAEIRTAIDWHSREIRRLDAMRCWYGYRHQREGETHEVWNAERLAAYERVTAYNESLFIETCRHEVARDALLTGSMPEPVGEQLDLFGDAA